MMIGYLQGTHQKTLPVGIILNVGQVGYVVETPLSTLSQLPPVGQEIALWIHTLVREDAIRFFGFITAEERHVFGILMSLAGVGPKVAMAMLSTLGVDGIRRSAELETTDLLLNVPGIGPRLAEKIIVELKAKLPKLVEVGSSNDLELVGLPKARVGASRVSQDALADVVSALENLGFKGRPVQKILKVLEKESSGEDFQGLLKLALARLTFAVGNKAPPAPESPANELDLF